MSANGIELVVGRSGGGAICALGSYEWKWACDRFGIWTAYGRRTNSVQAVVCYPWFRRAANAPIPKGKRARVRVKIEVLEVLDA